MHPNEARYQVLRLNIQYIEYITRDGHVCDVGFNRITRFKTGNVWVETDTKNFGIPANQVICITSEPVPMIDYIPTLGGDYLTTTTTTNEWLPF